MNQSWKCQTSSTNIKKKLALIFLYTSMEQVAQCSVHSLLQVSSSASMFREFGASIRIFQLDISDNRSGHKYGLTYAGLGWIIFRNEDQLPKYLKFELHYLGGTSLL
jgi:hypothetical protein